MLMTGSSFVDAERAFARAARGRRLAALARRLRLRGADGARLCVYGEPRASASGRHGVRDIPITAISGTLEPSRAAMFDRRFRPAARARTRWERVWLAEEHGAVMPPISVVQIGDSYAVRDGHHRVSVAKARGAVSIDATVETVDAP